MNSKRLLLIVFIALFICSCRFGGDKNILLRIKYNRYDQIDVKYRNYVVADNDNDSPIKNEYIRLGLTVDSVLHDSSYIFSAKIDYVRVKNQGIIGEEYSSDKDEAEMGSREKQLHEQFKPVLDSTYKFTLSKQGQVIKPFSFAGGRAIPPQYALIDLNVFQITFPKEKIAIGDEWTNERVMPGTGAKRTSTYHIEGIYDSTIQIRVEGQLQLPQGISKDFSGRYYLDRNTGTLKSCNIEMEANSGLQGKVKVVVSIEAH